MRMVTVFVTLIFIVFDTRSFKLFVYQRYYVYEKFFPFCNSGDSYKIWFKKSYKSLIKKKNNT
jgi:hypothetical protein